MHGRVAGNVHRGRLRSVCRFKLDHDEPPRERNGSAHGEASRQSARATCHPLACPPVSRCAGVRVKVGVAPQLWE
eukprot:CAMPEP_0182606322 /NCGR_PEP_ID=MMETSP1330-20130603/1199_1 /TAXON_ID=464278 /ORGANISM="Picochlorum sp., Strain RCC944" /LENGTH=74 /DNA_ID=CAMNT_0024824603 /DNA_START=73 /DNA_END=294 /DNA_ORIENTATION=+